jgi:ATP-dependent DNA helicase RecQ
MLRPYSCQLLVGAKHLEDKLSIIAKNSSPNASPVQLSVVSCQLSVDYQKLIDGYKLTKNYKIQSLKFLDFHNLSDLL